MDVRPASSRGLRSPNSDFDWQLARLEAQTRMLRNDPYKRRRAQFRHRGRPRVLDDRWGWPYSAFTTRISLLSPSQGCGRLVVAAFCLQWTTVGCGPDGAMMCRVES
jgi:hypothetical protein